MIYSKQSIFHSNKGILVKLEREKNVLQNVRTSFCKHQKEREKEKKTAVTKLQEKNEHAKTVSITYEMLSHHQFDTDGGVWFRHLF